MFGKSQRSPATTSPFRSRKGSPSPASRSPGEKAGSSSSERLDLSKPKENVTVTVRFRPLSARELKKGDETAWYADGDCTVRNEYNPNIAYAFDKVFGPVTTTHHVYDVAAHHVVSGAMEGINGTIFAYGVTSSGKTHTMHGVQKSPGIIPLAVKDVFEIIQETPGREFLLRVSYLEIYNEVINDLLDPTGQNLRLREDAQGAYVEGIKEEVVLSPAHALSLIATGEEHRHVGSNNFNLLSSRSHTIFTLTIEGSPRGKSQAEEDVTLSQLHLIDLAGSESSKTETNGFRRKEGSYINKSLLTLGTVISKLVDGKATHIPYRDSKLTRLLQSSLSGHGRISLICTVTPASSNSEETHNTLKFAHRSKHVEIKASQNKILDEKSLIKKYHKEISNLKQELQGLKHAPENSSMSALNQEDLVSLKIQEVEEGQARLRYSLEEEQEKAALMGRIQRLTKLILVSTKNTSPTSIPQKAVRRTRQSFCEDELAYLPDKKQEYVSEDDDVSLDSEVLIEGCNNAANLDEMVKDSTKNKKRGMLGWLKSRKPEHLVGLSQRADIHSSATCGSPSSCSTSSQNRVMVSDVKHRQTKSVSRKANDSFPERCQADELFSVAIDSTHVPLEKVQKFKNEINEQMLDGCQLEQRISGSLEAASQASTTFEMSKVKSADNKILQEQLRKKISENAEMQETILLLRQQLSTIEVDRFSSYPKGQNKLVALDTVALGTHAINSIEKNKEGKESSLAIDTTTPTSVMSLDGIFSREEIKDYNNVTNLNFQAAEIESLKQENVRLAEEKSGLEIHNKKLIEEGSYAKELATAAAIELQNLTEEVTKLSHQNAKLIGELDSIKEAHCKSGCCQHLSSLTPKNSSYGFGPSPRKLESALSEKEVECELQMQFNGAKRHEEGLEHNLLANMHKIQSGGSEICVNMDKISTLEELRAVYLKERRRSQEQENLISRLKGENLTGLDMATLEELQNVHVEAITKICQAKYANHML